MQSSRNINNDQSSSISGSNDGFSSALAQLRLKLVDLTGLISLLILNLARANHFNLSRVSHYIFLKSLLKPNLPFPL